MLTIGLLNYLKPAIMKQTTNVNEHMLPQRGTMEPKYVLLPKRPARNSQLPMGSRFHQIQALHDIPRHNVKAGDLGGYVSSETVLSHEGDCWIGSGAFVQTSANWQKATVSQSTHTPAQAKASVVGNALVEGDVLVRNTVVYDDAKISGNEGLINSSYIGGNAHLVGDMTVSNSFIAGSSVIETIIPSVGNKSKLSTISIIGCHFTQAMIAGVGSIQEASTDEVFDVSGKFKIKFPRKINGYKNLIKPFKASGDSHIHHNWIDTPVEFSGKTRMEFTHVKGESLRMHNGRVEMSYLHGIVDIEGNVHIKGATLNGHNILRDNAKVKNRSKLTGRNIISGDSIIPSYTNIDNQIISVGQATHVELPALQAVTPAETVEIQMPNPEPKPGTMPADGSPNPASNVLTEDMQEIEMYQEIIRSVEMDYETYTTDIVKLIKYPAMADSSVPETRKLLITLRSAKRVAGSTNKGNLKKVSEELESAFVDAENKAYTLADTFMDDKRKQSLKRAGNALSIALDENANEHERRAGYKSGIKGLEGVLPVSEGAIFALKERIGLKEIEA